jgi:hypothetical protein
MLDLFHTIGLGAGNLLPKNGKHLRWNVDHLLDVTSVKLGAPSRSRGETLATRCDLPSVRQHSLKNWRFCNNGNIPRIAIRAIVEMPRCDEAFNPFTAS